MSNAGLYRNVCCSIVITVFRFVVFGMISPSCVNGNRTGLLDVSKRWRVVAGNRFLNGRESSVRPNHRSED